jgi:non-specific serine/threonine protein kinase
LLGRWPLLRAWIEACAILSRIEGRPRVAVVLAGTASLLEHRPGVGLPVVLPPLGERWLAAARAAVGPSADELWAEGRSLSPADAMESALTRRLPEPPRSSASEDGHARLTRREQQVASLVAQGRTNREIGVELVIAEGTARVHVERILAKLHLRSRAQLAAWSVAQSAAQPSP